MLMNSKREDELLCYGVGHSLRSAIGCQHNWSTSRAGMTCHARREYFFAQNCNVFSVLSIFKYNSGKTNYKFITQ